MGYVGGPDVSSGGTCGGGGTYDTRCSGEGPGGGGTNDGGGGGGYGGMGGNAQGGYEPEVGGQTYGDKKSPTQAGSGGAGGNKGCGGNGGGTIEIDMNRVIINGEITADGDNNGNCHSSEEGGGGSGGSIWIKANTFEGSGKITADGGEGDSGNWQGGGGGGGRVAVWYGDRSGWSGSISAAGSPVGYDGGNDGTIYWSQTNNAPNNPYSLSPSGSGVGVSPTISASYSDPDGDSGTLYFETIEGASISSCSVSDRGSCDVTYSGADNWGTSYTFQVYAQDNAGATSGRVSQTFTTNSPPNSPSNPSPNDGANLVGVNPTLSVTVSDPESNSIDVSFYDGSGNQIGSTQTGVSSGATASVVWNNLNPGTAYSWYATASDLTGLNIHPGNFFEGWEDGSLNSWTMNSLGDSANGLTSSPARGSPYAGSYVVELRGNSGVLTSKSFTGKGTPKVTFRGAVWSLDNNNEFMDMDAYYDGSWHNSVIRIGNSKNGAGYKKYSYTFPSSASVSNMKIRFSSRASGSGDYFNIDNVNVVSTSKKFSFTTVSRPNNPSLSSPSPSGVSGVPASKNLKVDVSHPDGLSMDVYFYIDQGGDGTYETALTDTNVPDGGTASVNPSLNPGTGYSWYAKVRTSGYSTSNSNSGSPWTFTTNYAPSVDSVSATDSSSNHAFSSVSAMVSDPDGASDISSATLTVSDGDGNSNTYSSTSVDTAAGGSNQARIAFGSVSYTDMAGWSGNENMQLQVEVVDKDGRKASGSALRSFPNHAPQTASGFSYIDDPNNHAFTLSIDASDVDAGSAEISGCTVEHSDGSNTYSNTGSLTQGEPDATCSFRIKASSFTGYNKGDTISHNVTFTDVHGATVTSSTAKHMIPNTLPTASNLRPSGSEVVYGPTINATYNDDDGDKGSLTFYNSSSGSQIGSTQTGLSPGDVASVKWSSADTPGTTYNFTVKASDGLNATNTSENFTTIYQPQLPYDPFPKNNSVVDTTTRSGSDTAVSVKVKHPDRREMAVRFINATSGNLIDTRYGVESGSRAKSPNSQTLLRDETNTTYKWYAQSVDLNTNPPQTKTSGLFVFDTVEVGEVRFDFISGKNENVDITGQADNGNEAIKINVTSTIFEEVPRISINRTSDMSAVKTWTNVSNNSIIRVDLVQDGGQEWDLQTDREYKWFIEAYDGPNEIRTRGNFSLYTYNTTIEWDRSQEYYNVYQYDVYRASVTGAGNVGVFNKVGSTPETSFQDAGPGLEAGSEFCWKVAASNPSGSSDKIPLGSGVCKTLN